MIAHTSLEVKQLLQKSNRWGNAGARKCPDPFVGEEHKLMSFEAAVARRNTNRETFPYIAFHLGYDKQQDVTWVGFDIDDFRDRDKEWWHLPKGDTPMTDSIQSMIDYFPPAFVESSTNKRGIHVIFPLSGNVLTKYTQEKTKFVYTVAPLEGRSVELYFSGRIFIVSGSSHAISNRDSNCTEEQFLAEMVRTGVLVSKRDSENTVEQVEKKVEDYTAWKQQSPKMNDKDIKQCLLNSSKWYKEAYTVGKLWKSSTTDSLLSSASEYVYAMCAQTVFFTQDREQACRILSSVAPEFWKNLNAFAKEKNPASTSNWIPNTKHSKFDRLILTPTSKGNVLNEAYKDSVKNQSFYDVHLTTDAPTDLISDLLEGGEISATNNVISFLPVNEVIQNAHRFVSTYKKAFLLGDNNYYKYDSASGVYHHLGIEKNFLAKLRVYYSYIEDSDGKIPTYSGCSSFAKQVNDEISERYSHTELQNHTWIYNKPLHVEKENHKVCYKLKDCIYDLINDVTIKNTQDFFSYSTFPLSSSDLLSDEEYNRLFPESSFYKFLRTSLFNPAYPEPEVLEETLECFQIAFGYLMIPRDGKNESSTTSGAIMMKGAGGSGKSLMLKILQALFGGDENLSCNVSGADLGEDTGLHALPNKRFVFIEELDAVFNGQAQSRFKSLVTNETVSRVQKYEPTISKIWNVKVVGTCNDVIRTYNGDAGDAIRSRLFYFEFPTVFRGTANEDTELLSKIRNFELPIVLKWLHKGVNKYLKAGGLKTPASAKNVVEEQKQALNPYYGLFCEVFEVVQNNNVINNINSYTTTFAVADLKKILKFVVELAIKREHLIFPRNKTLDTVFKYDLPKLLKDKTQSIRTYASNRVAVSNGISGLAVSWTNIVVKRDGKYFEDISQFLPASYLTDVDDEDDPPF